MKKRAVPLRSAADGAFGAMAHSREREHAMALLHCIRTELPEGTQWFARDDLVRLSAFDGVALITAHRYVCDAVKWLLSRGEIRRVRNSRTGLALKGRGKGQVETPLDIATRHMANIKRTALRQADKLGGVVSVGDVLASWEPNDEVLTQSVRRDAIRTALRRMAMGGVLLETDRPGAYQRAPD